MTYSPEGTSAGFSSGSKYGTDTERETRFNTLDSRLEHVPDFAARIARKHWPSVERDQLPFRIGLLVLSLLCIYALYPNYSRFSRAVDLITAILMLFGIFVLVPYHLNVLNRRFAKAWSDFASDGELFKFLRETGIVLGHPIEMGLPDETFVSHFEVSFPDVVRAIESYLRGAALPDPYPLDAPAGLFVPAAALKNPPGGETHRVYEIEYRGAVTRSLGIRVAAMESGCDVTIGFPLRPSRSESRDRMAESLSGRLLDRMIAAKILADLRDTAGVPAMPIPVAESPRLPIETAPSKAV
jgi:hypothetical protein